MRLIKLLVLCVWALACGSADFEDYDGSHQDFISQGTTTAAADILTGYLELGAFRCTDTATTVCVVPGADSIKYAFAGLPGSVTAAANFMNAAIEGVPRFVNNQGSFQVVLQKGVIGSAGADHINSYLKVQCALEPTALTESLPGVFKRWDNCTCTVDSDKIATRGANAVERTNLQQHAYRQCFARVGGAGQQTVDSTVVTTTNILPLNASKVAYTSGERCRTTNYQASASPGAYVRSNVSGCANN